MTLSIYRARSSMPIRSSGMTSKAFALAIAFTLAACGSKPAANHPQPPGGTDAPGTLSGTVHFVGTPCPSPGRPPCDGPMPGYELTVLAADGTTVVTKTTTGDDGAFSLELPPGSYVILTQAGPRSTDQKRNEVTVARDALAHLDLTVDTGVR
jgi:hypothetical protein